MNVHGRAIRAQPEPVEPVAHVAAIMITTTATIPTSPDGQERTAVRIAAASLEQAFLDRLLQQSGKHPAEAAPRDWLAAVVSVARDRLIERSRQTASAAPPPAVKDICYFSMEFLIGRLLSNSLLNLGSDEDFRRALSALGVNLDHLCDLEPDAGLGNGGLGRLAACFLDSMATLSLPGYGYGIRYEYGLFEQTIQDGQQLERPDRWLQDGYPWELPRLDLRCTVSFGGRVVPHQDASGNACFEWVDTDDVLAAAYDADPRLRDEEGEHTATVVGETGRRFQSAAVQPGRLPRGFPRTERGREPVPGALSGRQFRERPRTAPASRSTSSSAPRCRTSCGVSLPGTTTWTRCPTPSRFS